jgi:hypothetical protein
MKSVASVELSADSDTGPLRPKTKQLEPKVTPGKNPGQPGQLWV